MSGLLTVRISHEGYLRGGKFVRLRLLGPGRADSRPGKREAIQLVNELGRADFGGAALRLLPNGSFWL